MPIVMGKLPSEGCCRLFALVQPVAYEEAEWESKVIHFSGDCHNNRAEGSRARRPLIHFYAFIMHADPAVDARVKRFARDRLRYRDEIFCKASQVCCIGSCLLSSRGRNSIDLRSIFS